MAYGALTAWATLGGAVATNGRCHRGVVVRSVSVTTTASEARGSARSLLGDLQALDRLHAADTTRD
jgi:hypothetical protein